MLVFLLLVYYMEGYQKIKDNVQYQKTKLTCTLPYTQYKKVNGIVASLVLIE